VISAVVSSSRVLPIANSKKEGAHPVFPFWRVHALRSKSEEPFFNLLARGFGNMAARSNRLFIY
jgi:hypothetical protein